MSRMDTKMVAHRNTMCYDTYYVCMISIPAVSRHDGAAIGGEHALANGRKTLDTGR